MVAGGLVAKSCLTLVTPNPVISNPNPNPNCAWVRLWPARILCPWNSPGKNMGIGGHFLLQGIFPTEGLNPVS